MLERLQSRRSEEGFTLIELLIVIIILGILAAIVVFAIGTTRSESVQNSCKTNVKAVQLSAEAVVTKTASYPAAQGGLITPSSGALLKSWPTSSEYNFTYAGTGTGYTLVVAGSGLKNSPQTLDNTSTDTAVDTACVGK